MHRKIFMLITTDPYSKPEKLGRRLKRNHSAYELALHRLKIKKWPIFKSTKNRKYIDKEAILLIYIAGNREYSKHIIATAEIDVIDRHNSIIENYKNERKTEKKHSDRVRNNRSILEMDAPFITGIPHDVLTLKNIQLLNKPVDLKSKLHELSFRPKEQRYWGTRLQGGCISLTESDFAILIKSD